ncbi:MAG: FecR domain-containing protein [Bacteroidota bacterium]
MAADNHIHELYERFLLGKSDPGELRRLIELFGTEENAVLEALIHQKLAEEQAIAPEMADQSKRYERILLNLREEILLEQKARRWKWQKITVAACITLVACSALLFFVNKQPDPVLVSSTIPEADVKPGGNKAFLTLSSGQKISLANAPNGIIAIEAGDQINKLSDGQIAYESLNENPGATQGVNILQTPNGGQYRVNLPDGTKVWLNAASSVKYSVNFKNLLERRIELTGEAYFEVAKDPSRSFIVQTDDQAIHVLGTRFNVNAYHDNGGSKTTLLEGSVKATTRKSAAIIRPVQQVTSQGDQQLKVEEADVDLALAWKNDQFMFESEPIRQLMKRLARWYDVDVVYGAQVPDVRFNGAISKFENISAVLKILESTGKAHFKVEGRKIYVAK